MLPSPGLRGTLRSRAYSFQRVHVTADEVQGAIRSVNNFVLVVRFVGVGMHAFTYQPNSNQPQPPEPPKQPNRASSARS